MNNNEEKIKWQELLNKGQKGEPTTLARNIQDYTTSQTKGEGEEDG